MSFKKGNYLKGCEILELLDHYFLNLNMREDCWDALFQRALTCFALDRRPYAPPLETPLDRRENVKNVCQKFGLADPIIDDLVGYGFTSITLLSLMTPKHQRIISKLLILDDFETDTLGRIVKALNKSPLEPLYSIKKYLAMVRESHNDSKDDGYVTTSSSNDLMDLESVLSWGEDGDANGSGGGGDNNKRKSLALPSSSYSREMNSRSFIGGEPAKGNSNGSSTTTTTPSSSSPASSIVNFDHEGSSPSSPQLSDDDLNKLSLTPIPSPAPAQAPIPLFPTPPPEKYHRAKKNLNHSEIVTMPPLNGKSHVLKNSLAAFCPIFFCPKSSDHQCHHRGDSPPQTGDLTLGTLYSHMKSQHVVNTVNLFQDIHNQGGNSYGSVELQFSLGKSVLVHSDSLVWFGPTSFKFDGINFYEMVYRVPPKPGVSKEASYTFWLWAEASESVTNDFIFVISLYRERCQEARQYRPVMSLERKQGGEDKMKKKSYHFTFSESKLKTVQVGGTLKYFVKIYRNHRYNGRYRTERTYPKINSYYGGGGGGKSHFRHQHSTAY